jgi:hypothetical protein
MGEVVLISFGVTGDSILILVTCIIKGSMTEEIRILIRTVVHCFVMRSKNNLDAE